MSRWLLVALLVMAWPEAAFAHSSVPGLSGLYWGMLHPFTSAAQLLLLIVLGLLVQQRLPASELVLFTFIGASLIGGTVAAAGYLPANVDILLLGLTVLAGLLVVSALPLPPWLLMAVGSVSGVAAGLVAWPDAGKLDAMLMTAFGAVIGSFLLVMLIAAVVEIVRLKVSLTWLPIAIRVAGAWVTAVAMLLGALLFKGAA